MAASENGSPLVSADHHHNCAIRESEKSQSSHRLCLHNSLSDSKIPFYTSDGSRRVTWYICGPTVYDTSHVGHARNYLTFDIIRRVLEGYFNYHVFYVMNITDVDDKIINRARRNYLLTEFLKTADDPNKVLSELMVAFEKEKSKQEKKVEEAKYELSKAASNKQLQELQDKVKQEELKLDKLNQTFEAVEKDESVIASLDKKEGIQRLVGSAADILASYLDDMGKSGVTDLAIFRAHAAKYEKDFFDDMQLLGVQPPDVVTRVTEYIDVIINYIEKIIERGFAYAANNSVYFDTRAFMDAGHSYGKLQPWAVGRPGLASESESDFLTKEKKNNIDFALWKASKPGEPFWPSPWGQGRPGWHIECSAMASEIIGSVVDIHSGGKDLMFPHHDNELAQAEAYYNLSKWVNFFLHSGHLSIEGLKMSKSLKNFITIKEALEKHTPRQLRLLFVCQAWDKPLNYSDSVMNEALTKEKELQNFFMIVKNYLRKAGMDGNSYAIGLEGPQRIGEEEKRLRDTLETTESEVQARLEDNLDTGGALQALLTLTSAVNSFIDKTRTESPRAALVRKSAKFITKMLVIFGLSDARENEIGFGSDVTDSSGNRETILAPYLGAIAAFRDEVRAALKGGLPKEEILGIADRFRDYTMVDLGVRLEDTVSGAIWDLVDAQELRDSRDQKIREAREANLKSLRSKLERKIKDFEKYEGALSNPSDFFIKQKDAFSVFDAEGIPTHNADGKELSKKARKDAEKRMTKAREEHLAVKRKVESKEIDLDEIKADIESLQQQIEATNLSVY